MRDAGWDLFQRAAAEASIYRKSALDVNPTAMSYINWRKEPVWAAFCKDFIARYKGQKPPDGRVGDAWLSISSFMETVNGNRRLFFIQETLHSKQRVQGFVFQVRCCCAVLLLCALLIRVQRKKRVDAALDLDTGAQTPPFLIPSNCFCRHRSVAQAGKSPNGCAILRVAPGRPPAAVPVPACARRPCAGLCGWDWNAHEESLLLHFGPLQCMAACGGGGRQLLRAAAAGSDSV